MILTDRNGRPFEKPIPPAPDAPIEAKIAYLRASNAYVDAVYAAADRAFDTQLARTLKENP